jgi:MFS family permease
MMQGLVGAIGRALNALGRLVGGQYVSAVGGPARARVIALFGAVLALSSADAATIGSVAPQLEHALHIGNTKIGLLSTVALLTGALFVLPVGMLVDRTKRIPILSGSIVLWSIASLASAFASSYSTLLLSRLALGAVTATAGPAIASLTGDYFPARERGRVYAYILGGEILGAAVGFIVTGSIASALGWRAAFVLLAIPGFFLARELWRTVPEPHRGGMSRLEPGAVSLEEAAAAPGDAEWAWEEPEGDEHGGQEDELAREQAQRRGIDPDPRLVLHEDPRTLGLVPSIRYILSIPTNLLMIASSALGYFFLSGLQTFAILFVRGHYHVSQLTAELSLGLLVIGAVIGTLISGRLTDAMLRRGILTARVWVPAICYFGATACLIPGVLGSTLTPALWFDVAGAALIQAANPPLDAARLDIMPAGLWGRAESTRTLLRSGAQALAPLMFGGLSQLVAGIVPAQTPVGTHATNAAISSSKQATGLEVTFLIMLVGLAAAGVFLWMARRTYPRDVATAAASHQGTSPPPRERRAPSRVTDVSTSARHGEA